jgi:glycosyltransferase involved in cell wall biosynthesis
MKKKTILYLSYWSLREPLNASAVFPYLRLLSEREDVEHVHLVTLETAQGVMPEVVLDIDKVVHTALEPRFRKPFLLAKALLFVESIFFLARVLRRERTDLLIAKASIAGSLADLLNRLVGVPYTVESFEPHSIYMLECGVWKKWSLRFLFSRWMENCQVRRAKYVLTVTHNHRDDLLAEGVEPHRVKVIPSITDLSTFRYDAPEGYAVREALGISLDAKVGIYVGKFGGLYYDHEAFEIFARAIGRFPDMHIIVLSPSDHEVIRHKALAAGIPGERIHVRTAMHVEVPLYLSAADMAFSTIKPAPIKRYQCPIKNGEYWACGLPILMTDEVSDDHVMMRQGIGGAVYKHDLSDLDHALDRIAAILEDPQHKEKMRDLARRYRSIDIARQVYREII